MRRKIISQKDSYTLTLPKQWIKNNSLKAGDEIDLSEDNNRIIIQASQIKKKVIELDLDLKDFNTYRSQIGDLYRQGFNEIKINFKEPKVLPKLQETVDSLFGSEIFDIKKDSCLIHNLNPEEDVRSHLQKIIHLITAIQQKLEEPGSREEVFAYRNKILKHKDIIARTIIQKKLIKEFPLYLVSFNLWNITRNYYHLYNYLNQRTVSPKELELIRDTNSYFQEYFKDSSFEKTDPQYREIIKRLRAQDKLSFVHTYCLNILMLIQSCSHL